MFSKEEKTKLYNLILAFNHVEGYDWLGENIIFKRVPELEWDYYSFLEFICKEEYITERQAKDIDDLHNGDKEGFKDYPENCFVEILYDKHIFDIWYLNYVSQKELNFETFYKNLKKVFLEDINEEELKSFVDTHKEINFDIVAKKAYINNVILNSEDISKMKEYFEALREVSSSDLENQIIDNIEAMIDRKIDF